jgi:hypothetical protein
VLAVVAVAAVLHEAAGAELAVVADRGGGGTSATMPGSW